MLSTVGCKNGLILQSLVPSVKHGGSPPNLKDGVIPLNEKGTLLALGFPPVFVHPEENLGNFIEALIEANSFLLQVEDRLTLPRR